jgi:hypothetical protein
VQPCHSVASWRPERFALEQANDIAPEVGLDVPVRTKRRSDAAEARNRSLQYGHLSATALCGFDHPKIIRKLALSRKF